jgi:serine phosphatase RsbU (regulator of sigma subunit)
MAERPTVLVIDDERAIRETLTAYLEDSDFRVIQAENGRVGIEQCSRQRPDVVLCDLRMPEMDGLEVLAAVKAQFPEMPIIVVSGMGRLSDAIAALKLGAWDYITKPIEDMAVLEHAINQALERSELLRKNREYQEHLESTNERLRQSLQRLREDEEAGRRIQFQLLPEAHLIYGRYELDRRLLTSLYLSGDFVDYFAIDNDHLGFYMADVSGHGVSSAFVTVLLKSYVNRYLELFRQDKNHGILDPARILTRLNVNILGGKFSKYLTMFFGVINTRENRLHFSNGGQFPFPILYDGERSRFIGRKGLPIGLFDFAEYQTDSLELPEQFTITMLSDGILDTLEQSKVKDKLEFLLSLTNRTQSTIESLLHQLGLDASRTLPDDITILLITKR